MVSSPRTWDADHNFSRKWFAIFININHKASSLKAKAQPAFLKVSSVKDPSSSARNPVKFMPGFSCSPLSPACSSTGRLQASVSRGSSAHVRLATLHGCPVLMQGIHRSEKRGQADAITFLSSAWGLETGSLICWRQPSVCFVCVYERVYVCVIVMTLCLCALLWAGSHAPKGHRTLLSFLDADRHLSCRDGPAHSNDILSVPRWELSLRASRIFRTLDSAVERVLSFCLWAVWECWFVWPLCMFS